MLPYPYSPDFRPLLTIVLLQMEYVRPFDWVGGDNGPCEDCGRNREESNEIVYCRYCHTGHHQRCKGPKVCSSQLHELGDMAKDNRSSRLSLGRVKHVVVFELLRRSPLRAKLRHPKTRKMLCKQPGHPRAHLRERGLVQALATYLMGLPVLYHQANPKFQV